MSFIESSYVTKYFPSQFFFLLLPFENVKTNLGSLGCTKVFIRQFWPAGYSLQTCDLYKQSCPYIYKRYRRNFFPLWLAVIQIKLIFFFSFLKIMFIHHLLISFQKQFVVIREDKNSLENVMEKLSHN